MSYYIVNYNNWLFKDKGFSLSDPLVGGTVCHVLDTKDLVVEDMLSDDLITALRSGKLKVKDFLNLDSSGMVMQRVNPASIPDTKTKGYHVFKQKGYLFINGYSISLYIKDGTPYSENSSSLGYSDKELCYFYGKVYKLDLLYWFVYGKYFVTRWEAHGDNNKVARFEVITDFNGRIVSFSKLYCNAQDFIAACDNFGTEVNQFVHSFMVKGAY